MGWGRWSARAACLSLLAATGGAAAQEALPASQQGLLATASPADPHLMPKLTPVAIEILDPVGSKISKSLDTFRIALAEPLMLGETVIAPAGTPGQGEVVHAKKAGGMGAAGELVIAARYLDINGRRLALRSTSIDAAGKSRVDKVGALAVASAATPLPIAMVGFFIKGGEIELPAGTRAVAKLAEDFMLSPGIGAALENSAPAPAAADRIGGNAE